MTDISTFLSFLHSDCEFYHVIHTMSDAKFHGEANGIYCRAIGESLLELWIII